MPITKKQQHAFATDPYTHCSELPALWGFGPVTLLDLWCIKRGLSDRKPIPKELAEWGEICEVGIIGRHPDRQKKGFRRNVEFSLPQFRIGGHMDFVTPDEIPNECKGVLGFSPQKAEYGDEGTDEVPDTTYYQCQGYCLGADSDRCIVHVFVVGRGIAEFPVRRNDCVIAETVRRNLAFWECVVNGTPPDGPISHDVASSLRPINDKTAVVDSEWIDGFEAARKAENEARKAKEQYRSRIESNALDAGTILDEHGVPRLQVRRQSHGGHYVEQGEHNVYRVIEGGI